MCTPLQEIVSSAVLQGKFRFPLFSFFRLELMSSILCRQLPNAGRGCVPCPDLECTGVSPLASSRTPFQNLTMGLIQLCGAPAYYSSESGACVLPTVVTEIPAVVTSTTTTGFPTVTVKLVSTTTPATSTITALTTAFTGRAACSYYRVVSHFSSTLTRVQISRDCADVRSQTFPEDCCPNKYVTGLRRVRIRRDESKLERRSIAFTTTTLAPVTTTRTVKGRFPPVTVTVSSFVEAPTPLTTTSTTAFAQSTACISTTRTGFGRCPTDPKAAVEALLKVGFALSSPLRKTDRITNSSQKYQESGERVVIDCGATGLYEQA